MTSATYQTSRPLRALGFILGGWTTIRVVALWSGGRVAELPVDTLAEILAPSPIVALPFARQLLVPKIFTPDRRHFKFTSEAVQSGVSWLAIDETILEHGKVLKHQDDPKPTTFADAPTIPGLAVAQHNRFSGSAWALMRGPSAASLASGGQLGGSQIGARLFYTPGPRPLSVTARISAPLSQLIGREAAIGVALRGRNVGLIAEQRISLDKAGHDTPAVFAYGGVSDVMLSGGLKLNGYAQAGVVGVKSPAAFVDGAIHIERTVIQAAKASLSVGAGAWGGAQPGVSRIDIGPQIVARIAVAKTNLRVSAEWRQRVARNATPASGPSVTVGFDF